MSSGYACLNWLLGQPPNIEMARRSVDRIIKDGKRASEIVKRVRALATKASIQKAPLDINNVINKVIALVQLELVSHGVSLRLELAAALPLVLADRVQLQQVIVNLMMNGMEAMQPVTERPRELTIRSQLDEAREVMVTVEDCGVGISTENVDRLFNAFFATKSSGMGMGLSICRWIVGRMGDEEGRQQCRARHDVSVHSAIASRRYVVTGRPKMAARPRERLRLDRLVQERRTMFVSGAPDLSLLF